MNYPSVKKISEIAPDIETARTIRGIIEGSIDPETVPQTAAWVRACFNRPDVTELKMHAVDVLLENYGVEVFETRSRGWCDYSNTGDTCAWTMVYFGGRFRVCSWGDIAERYG